MLLSRGVCVFCLDCVGTSRFEGSSSASFSFFPFSQLPTLSPFRTPSAVKRETNSFSDTISSQVLQAEITRQDGKQLHYTLLLSSV